MQHTKIHPCRFCPFMQSSAPGWLGGSGPEAFMEAALSEAGSPCHIDLEEHREFWESEGQKGDADLDPDIIEDLIVHDVEQCAGALAFATQQVKSFRNEKMESQRLRIAANTPNSATLPGLLSRDQFVQHHTLED